MLAYNTGVSFLPRDALVHSAVMRLLSSVCLSASALADINMGDLVQREHGEIWGRLGVGWRAGEQKRQYL